MGQQYNAYWQNATEVLYYKHAKDREGKGAFMNRIIQKHYNKKRKKNAE